MTTCASCQIITRTITVIRSDFQLYFFGGFFADRSSLGGATLGGPSVISASVISSCDPIDSEPHTSAGGLPDFGRMVVKRSENPALLPCGIIQVHRVLHAFRKHDVINIVPVSSKHRASDPRIGCRVPVRLGIWIDGTYIMKSNPDIIVHDDLVAWRNMCPNPGDLLLLQISKRQVIHIGHL